MKETVPVLVGAPTRVIVPVPPPTIVMPVLLDTFDRFSVTAPLPPVDVIVWLYARPTSPGGSVAGLRTTAGLTVNE